MNYSAAVIGCGRAGFSYDLDQKREEIYSHIGAYVNSERFSRVIAVDINQNTLSKVKEAFPGVKTYLSTETMFENENVDVLSIATGIQQREDLTSLACDNNVKAIFCEKPIAHNLDTAQKIIDMCKQKNISLAVNHFRRWDQLNSEIRDFVKSDRFGEIQNITVKYNNGIFNTGSHIFDLIRMIFGDIVSIKSSDHIVNDRKEDPSMSLSLKLESGDRVDLMALDQKAFRIFELDIIGTKSRIVIHNGYDTDFYSVSESPYNSEFNILSKQTSPFTRGRKDHYEKSVLNIVDSMEVDATVKCCGADAKKSLEAVIAACISYSTKEEVFLPLDEKHSKLEVKDIVL